MLTVAVTSGATMCIRRRRSVRGESALLDWFWIVLLIAYSIDYILQLAVEMHKLGLPWTKN